MSHVRNKFHITLNLHLHWCYSAVSSLSTAAEKVLDETGTPEPMSYGTCIGLHYTLSLGRCVATCSKWITQKNTTLKIPASSARGRATYRHCSALHCQRVLERLVWCSRLRDTSGDSCWCSHHLPRDFISLRLVDDHVTKQGFVHFSAVCKLSVRRSPFVVVRKLVSCRVYSWTRVR